LLPNYKKYTTIDKITLVEKFRRILERDRKVYSNHVTYKKIISILEEYDEFLNGLKKAFEA
jgi:hypothetical protein